jgi:hypothetical protein
VFRQLVLARIIEPTSKADSRRVLAETGIGRRLLRHQLKRRLQGYADDGWRRRLAVACTAHARLVWGSRSWPELVTCGDRSPSTRHDRLCRYASST